MMDAKGAPAPFFFRICSPRQRDEAMLNLALQSFEEGHLAEALIAAEYANRRHPNNCLPAILRAKILSSQPNLAAKAWYRAWCCDPMNPTLQDAMLQAWIASGAAATAAELGAAFLPARCRAGTHESLLALLRQCGHGVLAACWKTGEHIDVAVFGPPGTPAGARVRLLLSDELQQFEVDVPADGSRVRMAPPRAHGVWSLALAAQPGARPPLVMGSPLVFAAPAAANQPVPADQRRRAVAIVIPVYRDGALVQHCIASVLASLAHNRTEARVVVVDDASPEPLLSGWLDQLAAAGQIVLLRNARNLGFIETVNRGMRALPQHNPLLLNADTLVQGDWLDRLCASLYSAPDVASVSPWSNNGEISSFPRIAHPAPAPSPAQLAALDTLAARLHRAGVLQDAEVPAVCGFAMLLRRSVIDRIGLFDGAELERGYSEEVDWCQRARLAGQRHLIATGVFVAHVGTVSFRFEKTLRVRQNRAVIAARYPDFYAEYQRAVRDDILAAPRAALLSALHEHPAPQVSSSPRRRGPITPAQQGDANAATEWLAAARTALDGLGEIARPLPAALPQRHPRVGLWQTVDGPRFATQALALARLLASQPAGSLTPRLLVIGECSDALWRTGMVDAIPFNPHTAENTLLSDAAVVGLSGCSALLGAAGAAAPYGIPYTALDDTFDPAAWLAAWRSQHPTVIPAQAGTPDAPRRKRLVQQAETMRPDSRAAQATTAPTAPPRRTTKKLAA
ncbi:MAG: glycosyltransferase family 2 protein [Telluria sp.]